MIYVKHLLQNGLGHYFLLKNLYPPDLSRQLFLNSYSLFDSFFYAAFHRLTFEPFFRYEIKYPVLFVFLHEQAKVRKIVKTMEDNG